MILNYIVWDINPEIFHIGPLSIRWYGALFAFAFFAGFVIFQRFFKKENIQAELLDSLLVYMMVGTVIGARLGHCFFYDFEYYSANPIEIFKVWKGGLASHGAAIGILVSLWLFCRKFKRNYLWLLDRIGIVVALSGVFIRTGNLFNSEIYGTETSLPWGFIFVRTGETLPKHPTQIYEALSYLVIFGSLLYMYSKNILVQQKGKLFGIFLVTLFTARFLIEGVKNPQSEFETTMIMDMGQLLSLPFITIGLWLLFRKDKASA